MSRKLDKHVYCLNVQVHEHIITFQCVFMCITLVQLFSWKERVSTQVVKVLLLLGEVVCLSAKFVRV